MIYFKSVLIGLGAVLLGCVVTPIAMTMWISWKSGVDTVSFSPMGLANHLAHSLGFWVFIVALFSAGFLPSVHFLKR